jgi:hypothetical protein
MDAAIDERRLQTAVGEERLVVSQPKPKRGSTGEQIKHCISTTTGAKAYSPITEGDVRYFCKLLEKLPDVARLTMTYRNGSL